VKKKILIAGVAAALVGGVLFWAIPALAQSQSAIDHVVISPASATLSVGGVQQFTAQAYDSNNEILSNVSYFWLVTSGGGAINNITGLFTAGGLQGTYANTVEVVAVQGNLTKIANASVTVTGTAGVLTHIIVTPANATASLGGTQSFTAQGYDINNVAIPGLSYLWSVLPASGSINQSGLFSAGATPGTYTVQATVTQGQLTISGFATAVVTTGSASISTTAQNFDAGKLIKIFGRYLKGAGFDNFLGGQWQVKNGAGIDTIAVVPGIVQSNSTATSLSIIPNGSVAPSIFPLASTGIIRPSGTTLAPGDKVVLITVNGQVTTVLKVSSPTSGQTSQKAREREDGNSQGQQTPPGWSHGKKMGWQKSDGNRSEKNDD